MTTPEIKQTFHFIFNVEEKKALLELIHVAVKTEGLNVAVNAVVLAQKINAAPEIVSTPQKE